MKFTVFSLKELENQIGEDKIRNQIKTFSSKDNDIEDFLINKSIFFEKISISTTYLVFDVNRNLVGYFSIANRSLTIQSEEFERLSNTLQKKLIKSGTQNKSGDYVINSFLLGQIGKNFSIKNNSLSGNELLKIAYGILLEIKQKINVKFIWLECQDNEKLLRFYSTFGFSQIKGFTSESGYKVMIMELK